MLQFSGKMVLENGWTGLDASWQRRAEKLLGGERISELLRQREERKARKPPEETQMRLF